MISDNKVMIDEAYHNDQEPSSNEIRSNEKHYYPQCQVSMIMFSWSNPNPGGKPHDPWVPKAKSYGLVAKIYIQVIDQTPD